MKLRSRAALSLLLLVVPITVDARKPKPLPPVWVSTWSSANAAVPAGGAGGFVPGAAETTLRQIVPTSIASGPTPLVRMEFTNAFGTEPLSLGEVHIALANPDRDHPPTGDILLATANALTFGGANSITIPAGGEVTSDPVLLTLPAHSSLVISILLPAQKITTATADLSAAETAFLASGNVVSQRSLAMPPTHFSTTKGTWFLKSVDVLVPATPAARP